MSPSEVWAALRQAGVHRRDDVRAVVMEALLDGVRGREHRS